MAGTLFCVYIPFLDGFVGSGLDRSGTLQQRERSPGGMYAAPTTLW